MLFITIGLAAALMVHSPGASAGEPHRLTANGTRLGTLLTAGVVDDLRLVVSYADETPRATYVYAQIAGAELRQRTNLGYWIPWNGDPATLIDNGFAITGGRIEYKILDQDLGRDNQGITIVIGYRTDTAFKFGSYAIIPGEAGR